MNLYNPFSLKNKTILVTGASSGIGKAIAIECAKMGAILVVTARNKERLQNTFSQLEASDDRKHKMILADMKDNADILAIVEQSPELDGLVNCAGIVKQLLFSFSKSDYINEIMSVNFNAPAILTQMLIKQKKIKKNASIIFMSSISGIRMSFYGNAVYSASKSALSGLVKGIALELAPKKIRVNAIAPGMVNTHIMDSGMVTDEQLKEDQRKYPLKRYGKPEEIAYAAIYLLSDASLWVTGTNLIIDGGYTIQ